MLFVLLMKMLHSFYDDHEFCGILAILGLYFMLIEMFYQFLLTLPITRG